MKKRSAGVSFLTKGRTTYLHLPGDHVAVIDTQDLEEVRPYAWHAVRGRTSVYVYAQVGRPQRSIQLHRLIFGFPESDIDHRDGNGLNNRRKNLRIATESQNGGNSRKTTLPRYSIYKGVSRKNDKWFASIRKNRNLIYLGTFRSETDAASYYDRAAIFYFGEFARLNFPKQKRLYIKEPYIPRVPATICQWCHGPIPDPHWLKKVFCSNRCKFDSYRADRAVMNIP